MKIEPADLFAAPSKRGRPRQDIKQRLFKYRRIESGHWMWTGWTSRGYGSICLWTRTGRTNVSVPRLACFIWLGLDLKDRNQVACHKNSCHEPLCFNPDHLYVGTYQSNSDDMHELGSDRAPSGEEHYAALFEESEVRQIRAEYASGRSVRYLADKHGVQWMTMYAIVKRKNYRNI